MPTLYRKYRPQTFAEIAGQEPIKLTLAFEISAGHLAHAYLFCGPRAIGKTTMARLLAKAVNCQKRKKGSADPCNECQSCLETTAGASLDVIEIDAASHTGVDNVRDAVIAAARIAPTRSHYKVFIIDEAHMLSTAAFNALLKVMEEPPAQVIFVLCTTEAHKLPATIVSRCQRFDFKKIGYGEVVKKLNRISEAEGVKIEAPVIEAVARHAGGHMRDAESLLGQIIALGGQEDSAKGKAVTLAEAELIIPRNLLKEVLEIANFLADKDAAGAVAYLNALAEDGVDLKLFADQLVESLRRLLLAKVNAALGASLSLELGEGMAEKLSALSLRFETTGLAAAIERIYLASREIKHAPIAQLPLELAIVDICFGKMAFETESAALPSFTPPVSSTGAPRAAATSRPTQSAPSVAPSAKAAPVGDGKPVLTAAALQTAWQELLLRIPQLNHSLAFVLRSCQPAGLQGSVLTLAFKYKIHHDRMNDMSIRGLVEQLLAEISGQNLSIALALDPGLVLMDNNKPEAEVVENRIAGAAVAAAGIDSGVIDNLLKTFGGKVVG